MAVVEHPSALPVDIRAEEILRASHDGTVGARHASGPVAHRGEEVVIRSAPVNARTFVGATCYLYERFGLHGDVQFFIDVEFRCIDTAETAPEEIGLAPVFEVELVDRVIRTVERRIVRIAVYDLPAECERAARSICDSVCYGMSVVGSHVAPPHREEEDVFAPDDADFGGPEGSLAVTVTRFRRTRLLGERRACALPRHQIVRMPDREQVGRIVEPERAIRIAQYRRVGTVLADHGIRIGLYRAIIRRRPAAVALRTGREKAEAKREKRESRKMLSMGHDDSEKRCAGRPVAVPAHRMSYSKNLRFPS